MLYDIVAVNLAYFLALWLILALCVAAVVRRGVALYANGERVAVPLFGGYAVLGAVLLFQHYFVGPYYTIPLAY